MTRVCYWFIPAVIFVLLSGALAESGGRQKVSVSVDMDRPIRTISKYLTGSHFVYAFERDSLYADERIAEWMRKSRVGVIRWPGGTAVQSYHWDSLNGVAFKEDSWDPDYQAKDIDSKNYMDLDEYVAYCRRVGAEPMVGINIKSGKKYKREAEAINEAQRLITYCRDKEYQVRYWYIGNECFKGFGASRYAEYIDRYAKVLRSVDSNIVIIGDWKFAPESKNRFAECVEIATKSRQIDVLEIHEKWGNDWSLSAGGSKSDWKNECPLYDGKLGDYTRRFHQSMTDAGRANVKLAFNEWGIGKLSDGDEFDHALVAADYLIELFRNDVFQACYWNLNMGPGKTRVLATTDDRRRLVRLNPIAHVFEMYAHALGNVLLDMQSSAKEVYGFAAKGDGSDLQVYLINKSHEAVSVKLIIENSDLDAVTIRAESFISPGVMVTNDLGGGTVSRGLTINAIPWSFNRIIVKRDHSVNANGRGSGHHLHADERCKLRSEKN